MNLEEYNKIYECLDQLRSDIDTDALLRDNPTALPPSPNIDIIKLTAVKINKSSVNVFRDNDVNWEEVTMFRMDNINRLLHLIEDKFLSDVGKAIIISIDDKYDPNCPFMKPQVNSGYYDPSTDTLPEYGDWDYSLSINNFIDSIKQKRQLAMEFQKKIEADKAADGMLYNSAEAFISKLNEDPDFTNKMAVVSKAELERLQNIERQFESLNQSTKADRQETPAQEEDKDELETSFTATPQQTILLFRELGFDFTNATLYNKTKVKKMLAILTTKAEGNINKKLSGLDHKSKFVQNDINIVKKLLKDIKK